jgi:hypothetical protein
MVTRTPSSTLQHTTALTCGAHDGRYGSGERSIFDVKCTAQGLGRRCCPPLALAEMQVQLDLLLLTKLNVRSVCLATVHNR